MSDEAMTPRERWLAVLEGREPDRVPMDYWGTDEVTEMLMRHTGSGSLVEMYISLGIDGTPGVEPEYVGPPIPEEEDVFGCRYRDMHYKTGFYRECVYHPLTEYESVEEIEREYVWPDIEDYDHSVIPAQLEGWEGYPVKGGGSEPFLDYVNLRGRQQAYVDLFVNKEIVHHCLDEMFNFRHEYTERIYREIPGEVVFSYVAEDLGSQRSLLFSPSLIHEFFIPRMRRMIDLAHRHGVYAFFHSDGAIREILPDMIEAGIDVLNPIQWRCTGMEREALKRDFGEAVVFHGGMDNQQTLPFGTTEEVRMEVQENLDFLGGGRGYILAPCHNIQPLTPVENILAMYDEGQKQGKLG
jgi:uroporphyrinogen decarboxylase